MYLVFITGKGQNAAKETKTKDSNIGLLSFTLCGDAYSGLLLLYGLGRSLPPHLLAFADCSPNPSAYLDWLLVLQWLKLCAPIQYS